MVGIPADKLAQMARSDDSQVVRPYLASAAGRMPHGGPLADLAGLVSHAEDAKDHNLPQMDWYAIAAPWRPDNPRLLELASGGRIPLLVEYSVRRIGAGLPEAIGC